MVTRCAVVTAATVLAFAVTQDVGDFARARGEYAIEELGQPFVVRSVSGRVSLLGDPEAVLPTAFIEIQGPGKDRTIRRATVDQEGRFRIRRVPQGQYKFKVTDDGFQGVMGTIVVSKSAPKNNEVLIGMHPGT
jgi:hypothetical protein